LNLAELARVTKRCPYGAGLIPDLICRFGQAATKEDAMDTPATQTREVISFGPFSLVASERLLTKEGAPVALGARTLDILTALVSRPNEAVSKRDLLGQVWPDVAVEEGSLRFHIASLRKALGDGKDGARYITTLAGRGYCFVAPVSRSSHRDNGHKAVADRLPRSNLPSRLIRMIGRVDDALKLSKQISASRFVTIVGPGGVGKTTVAVAVGHDLIEAFTGAVVFVDLGALSDPSLVAPSIASILGLSVQSDDAIPGLIAYLKDKRILLILDTCEHLVEGAAGVAERTVVAAPQVHILATSREALRVKGEHVYKLAPLACPPDDPEITAAVAQTFPATQLFVERALASGARLDLTDADAAIVAGICRKLDGMPLAIELAAGRVEAYGLEQTAALLDRRLTLSWQGQRTAPQRQRTLQATLDWSYGLLSELERVVLRRLAVFVGYFSIDAALTVVTSATVDQTRVFGAIDSLVAKSMVAARPLGAMMRYRLLDTTRHYALEIAVEDAELADLAARHATYYQEWLEQTGIEWPRLSNATERAPHLAALANVRAALEWCFGVNGNAEIGVALASAAAPVFLAMSLLTECQRWSERAIVALDNASHTGPEEMRLRAALGVSLMFTRGGSDAARVALSRSLAIAEEQGSALDQLGLLGPLQMFHLRTGNFQSALHYAKRCSALAATMEDSAATALCRSVLGISLHLSGDLSGARAELEAALRPGPRSQGTTTIYLGFEGRILAGAIQARTLWLQGHPAQALERARETVKGAAGMDHSLTLSIALIWAISVFLWRGDLVSAEEHIDWLIYWAECHSLAPYVAVGRGFKAELAIRRGNAKCGVEGLETCLVELHVAPYKLLTTPFNIALVQGLAAMGRTAEAIARNNDAISLVEASGDLVYLPELLRLKGNLLLAPLQASRDEAEACLMQSLKLSRRQGARAWELRTAVDLAALLAADGKRASAQAILEPVFQQFVEGLDTEDLKAAERLLTTLA
jgi:predicted ATPase/DNA-binding winged helix-turn-helix (wHTH) protein